MKIKNIILISLLAVLSFSCSDELDYTEVTSYSKEQVFSSFSRTANFVTDIYGRLDYDYGLYGDAMLASVTDEADYAWATSSIHNFYNGAWSALNPRSENWTNFYAAIRAANFYLEASEGQTFEGNKYDKTYEEQLVRFNRYQYEVRFLRAYYYFGLVRQYGDVPFTTEVLTESEANQLSRVSSDEIFDFIVTECDAIVDHLPVKYTNLTDGANNETGRVGKIAVMALKARVLLYQASPLFNPTNDKQRWKDAAVASKAVIDASVENGITLGAYTSLWGTESYAASEGIFMRRVGDLNYLESLNFPVGVEGGNSGNCPTQTLVDAYEMKATGKKWNEAGSGYDASNPYSGRDPRFGMTIAKNGDEKWPTYNTFPLETFEGGKNGSPLPGATTTGYYLKKLLDASVDLRPNSSNSKRHSYVMFRLGEFYLNYAEATYNFLGSPDATSGELTMSAVEAVNKIRSRTGVAMPALATGLNNDEFYAKYVNERMVELAFEGHRFWDVRRWKRGELFKSITAMKLTKDSQGNIVYTRFEKQRGWNDKMYFFPIPDLEIRKNSNLTQNPGW